MYPGTVQNVPWVPGTVPGRVSVQTGTKTKYLYVKEIGTSQVSRKSNIKSYLFSQRLKS